MIASLSLILLCQVAGIAMSLNALIAPGAGGRDAAER
jgi:hypothetical protein